jgi:hypothetical protein
LMGGRHRGGHRRRLAVERGAARATDALPCMDTFHTMGGEPDIAALANQGIRDGRIMVLDFDMVLDVHRRLLPLGLFIRRGGERP